MSTRIESMEQFIGLPVGAKTSRNGVTYEKVGPDHWVSVAHRNHRLPESCFSGAINLGLNLVEEPTARFTVGQQVRITGNSADNPAAQFNDHRVGSVATVEDREDDEFPGTAQVQCEDGVRVWVKHSDLEPVEGGRPAAGQFWLDSDDDVNYVASVHGDGEERRALTIYFHQDGTYGSLIVDRDPKHLTEKIDEPDWWDPRFTALCDQIAYFSTLYREQGEGIVFKTDLNRYIARQPEASVVQLAQAFDLQRPMRQGTLTVTARGTVTRPVVEMSPLSSNFAVDAGALAVIPWTRTFMFSREAPVGECDHGNPLALVREQLTHEGVVAENLTISGEFCDSCAF